MNLNLAIDICIQIVKAAGTTIMEIYQVDFVNTIEHKSDSSPLTQADLASNRVICEALRVAFPQIPILSEEEMDNVPREVEYCWIVDPLDGTKEFINRNGQFTVNIGLVQNHKVILGVVGVPVTRDIYYAAKDIGAFKKTDYNVAPIKVTNKKNDLIWVGSRSHSSEKEYALIERHQDQIVDILAAGSSLKGLMVAEGKADIYYRFGYTCEWDTCAMQCIVEEAGGICQQMDGSDLLYNRDNHLNEKGFYIVNHKDNIWV